MTQSSCLLITRPVALIPVPCSPHHVRGSLNPTLILIAPDEQVSPWVPASITYGWILVVKHFEWSLRLRRCYISTVHRIISLSPAMTHQETSAFLLSLRSHACSSYSSGGVFHLNNNFFFFFFSSSNRDRRNPTEDGAWQEEKIRYSSWDVKRYSTFLERWPPSKPWK